MCFWDGKSLIPKKNLWKYDFDSRNWGETGPKKGKILKEEKNLSLKSLIPKGITKNLIFKPKLGQNGKKWAKKIKKGKQKWNFWDRKSLIQQKINKNFDFASQNWGEKVFELKKSWIPKGITKIWFCKPKLGVKMTK